MAVDCGDGRDDHKTTEPLKINTFAVVFAF